MGPRSNHRRGAWGGWLISPSLSFAILSLTTLAQAAPAPPTDRLLDALRAAPDAARAGTLEAQLQETWHDQASPAVQMLMDHAAQSAANGKPADALADSEAALVLQPALADLWRRRAEAKYGVGDETGAFADLAQALLRERRLIPAWVDLSRFAEARHDNKRALEAWRKVLELDPQTEGGSKRLERLQHLVNGQPI
jgi:tetratricopeptide (TPR) repeat protein